MDVVTPRMMFNKILVPVDLTDKNVGAIETARELAMTSGGEVCLQHVIEELDVPFEELEGFYRELEQKAHRKLDELSQHLQRTGIDFSKLVCYGKRAPEIVSCARDNDVDLIVITSHKVGPENWTTGIMTISHQVAIAAPCPVLILR